ncbi:hypothetical protein JOQ06_013829 [Pogonophryne albipinna]|uniref:Uncharacterized protein n=1 Tax=Pogonophryne albipinna TaxID=1090488 RepID=A0AAD6BLT1_9TELE|nr:hypothetical protein JOQ06_013829 [Pogonophryne albipinna]
MAAASYLLSEDQFLCSICLDLFTDPVSTSCGHNFCKDCITEHWDRSDWCQCPMCKKEFNTRPELHVNTFISEMVAQFRQSAQQKASSSSSSSEQQVFKPGEVPCDVCTETKLKALTSCLVCLTSYCETHLEPHLTKSVLKRHQLIDPVENLEDRMCPKHDKPLELFCKTDQTCVCMLCHFSDHKMHDVVPLKEEYEDKKAELGKTEAKIQQMIQRRRLKIQEVKHSVDLTEKDADREVAELVQVFTALKESVERLINTIKEKQKETENKAETLIKELDLEISQLKKRSAKTDWELGVARESINRMGKIRQSPQRGIWIAWLRNGNEYKALDDPPVSFSLKSQPQKVGVFVDYEEGLVYFYDVDAAALIYSFTGCSFTEKLFPYFSPCVNDGTQNSAPLIISPVRVN